MRNEPSGSRFKPGAKAIGIAVVCIQRAGGLRIANNLYGGVITVDGPVELPVVRTDQAEEFVESSLTLRDTFSCAKIVVEPVRGVNEEIGDRAGRLGVHVLFTLCTRNRTRGKYRSHGRRESEWGSPSLVGGRPRRR